MNTKMDYRKSTTVKPSLKLRYRNIIPIDILHTYITHIPYHTTPFDTLTMLELSKRMYFIEQ